MANVRHLLDTILASVLRKSQINTLEDLVVGLLEAQRVGIASIGRGLPGAALDKSKINRVNRFASNKGVVSEAVAQAMIAFICKRRKSKRLFIAIDWTKLKPFNILVAAIVTRHRAIPVFWMVNDSQEKRDHLVEEEFIQALKRMIPADVSAVVLADRGYDRADFLQMLGQHFPFVVRFRCTTCISTSAGPVFKQIGRFVIKRNVAYDFPHARYTEDHKVPMRIVVVHDKGHKERWHLATNLAGPNARQIVEYYGRRFEIEESFKDMKDVRAGFHLKCYQATRTDRLARVLIVVVLAYVFLVLVGLYGEQRSLQYQFQCNTVRSRRVLAVWRVGLYLYKKSVEIALAEMLSFVLDIAYEGEPVHEPTAT